MNDRFQLPDKGPLKWTPEDRALWLAKHGAPANMRLVTDLELHVIAQGLEAERKKAVDHEARANKTEAELAKEQARLEYVMRNGFPVDGSHMNNVRAAIDTAILRST